jgi:hypothetical protein
MTRVAHVMAGAVNGGAELFFERLCLALHEAGEDVLPVIRTDAARAARLAQGGLARLEHDSRFPTVPPRAITLQSVMTGGGIAGGLNHAIKQRAGAGWLRLPEAIPL